MSEQAEVYCTMCGARMPGLQFCTSCGTRLSPPTAAPTYTPPPASVPHTYAPPPPGAPRPPRRGLAAVLTVVIVLVLLGAGGVAAYVAWPEDEATALSADRRTTGSPSDPGSPSASDSDEPASTPSATLSATASPAPPARQFVCWDDQVTQRAADCTLPHGVAGLAWVFPSFDPSSSSCYDAIVGTTLKRPTMWECAEQVNGRSVLVRYSEVGNVAKGLSYYSTQFAGGSRTDLTDRSGSVGRYVWRLPYANETGVYKLSSMYTRYPYSISIEAGSIADREDAMQALLAFTPPGSVRGHRE